MLIEILVALSALGVLFYFWMTKDHTYWKDRGIPYIEGRFPFGYFTDAYFAKRSFFDLMTDHMEKLGYGTKYYGVFENGRPQITICDPEMVRAVLVKDFDHFVDRNGQQWDGMFSTGTQSDDIWAHQLTMLTGTRWKDLRSTFSPIFTSGKMKSMTGLINVVANEMTAKLESLADNDEEIDLKKVFGNFAMGAVASCAFGVDARTFDEEQSPFVVNAERIFNVGFKAIVKFIVSILPGGTKMMGMFGISASDEQSTLFFYNVIMDSIEQRRRSKERRNDLVDLMLDAVGNKNLAVEGTDQEQFDVDSKLNHKRTRDVTELELVSTALVLMAAGYETTATTLVFLLYDLLNNPDVLEKLQSEIDDAFGDKADLDYADVVSLEYLDMAVHESLRLRLPTPLATRGVTKDYTFAGTDIHVKKGEMVLINAAALHFNPGYYTEPQMFRPENFSKENKAKRSPYTFLSFGQGPRGCIGMRFALLEVKLAAAKILRNFNLVRSDKTPEKIEYDPKQAFRFVTKEPIVMKLQRRRLV